MADNAAPAQSPYTCQFCDESVEIKLFCVNCELFLCLLCNRKIHSRSKTCQDHKIIQLRDLGSEEVADTHRRVDLVNLTCYFHKGLKYVEFCNKCRMTICLKCSYEFHQDHTRSDLEEFYGIKLIEVQKMKDDCNENISVVDSQLTKLTKKNADKMDECNKVIDDINKTEADVIAEVKKHSQKLRNEVYQVYQPIFTEIRNDLSEVKLDKSELIENKKEIENILNSHQAADVINASKAMFDMSLTQRSSNLPTSGCVFTPGFALNSKVGELLGDVHKIPQLKLVHTYQTELEGVTSIIRINKIEKVISSRRKDELQIVRFHNDTMTVIKEENLNVCDMALVEDGALVISSRVCSDLKIFSKYLTLRQYKSFTPLLTLGVHVNKNNQILLGLVEPRSIIVTKDTIRKIVVLNQSGDIQHTYEYTNDKQRLFTWPRRIITCQDTICVVDLLNDLLEGRVVALNYSGQIQWVYNGEGKDKFYPRDMAVTPTCLILVTDLENHAIHVLNPRGQVIVCHQVLDLGVEYPFSLCLDKELLLWVGCFKEGYKKDKVHVFKGIE